MFKDIAFTVYAVTDIVKSRAFYEGTLDLVPNAKVDADSKWVEYNIGSGTIAIGQSPDWKPSEDGAVVALEAKDFNHTIAQLKAKNVVFVLEPQDFPTCHMAVVLDPDKNRVLIHQRKTN